MRQPDAERPGDRHPRAAQLNVARCDDRTADTVARLASVAQVLDQAVLDPAWLELDVLLALADVVRRAERDLAIGAIR